MPDASRFPEAKDTGPDGNPGFPQIAGFGNCQVPWRQLKAACPADAGTNIWTCK